MLLDLGFNEEEIVPSEDDLQKYKTIEGIFDATCSLLQTKLEQLEIDIEDRDEEVKKLKQQLNTLKTESAETKETHLQQIKAKDRALREISEQSKMSDATHQVFVQTWDSICSRFDNTQLEKFKDQAKADSENWIQQRLMKAIEGSKIDKSFISLFQHQVVILFQLYFFQKAQNQLLFDKDKRLQIEQAQNAKLIMDIKEVALQLKQN